MKRFLWAGAAVVAAAVVAVPLWLALDDDGARRTGALVAPTAAGDVGRLVLVAGIAGSVTVPVESFDLEARAPRDAATGQQTGNVIYTPLKVLKPIDEASARLFKMLIGNEKLTTARLELTSEGAEGKVGTYMSYDFANARVSEWREGASETIALTHTGVVAKPGGAKPPAGVKPVIGQMTYGGAVLPITGFGTLVEASVDPATGLTTNKRKHNAVSVVRTLDTTAPTVLANMKNNVNVGQVTIELQHTNADGKATTYATYTYGNVGAATVNDFGAAGEGASQRFEFVYQSVEVSTGGFVASDSLAAP